MAPMPGILYQRLKQFKKLTVRGIDVIMVTAANKTALDESINAAIRVGIPVINFDADSPASARLTFERVD
jgi:ribose transport system substrate-binding protein